MGSTPSLSTKVHSDGSEVGSIPMADKEPQFMVDAIGRRVYYFSAGGGELVAYSF